MPSNLSLLEEIDIITELQSPEFVYSTDSLEEQIAFSKYIGSLSIRRVMLLSSDVFDFPFVIAGLKEAHIETILKEERLEVKNSIIKNLSNPDFLKQVSDFADELDKRGRTTENSTRLKNILQYLRDSRFVV